MLQALRLDRPDPAFDARAQTLAAQARTPGAVGIINIFNPVDGSQHFIGMAAAPGAEGLHGQLSLTRTMPGDWGYCPEVGRTRTKALVLSNVLAMPRFCHNPVVSLGVRSYAGIALITYTGLVLGTACFIGTAERDEDVHYPWLSIIKDVAAQTMAPINQKLRQLHL
ncbi:GAF domain-containing protein [Streptomyces spectabilis]|uniref:GAF domain-containing protein n=1 Tax=Streptomyces spectabilis TaxID=68270 RepID=UPI0033C3BA58